MKFLLLFLQFQADQKKDIDLWKEHLLKVTDQGYTDEELQAINSIVKDDVFSTEINCKLSLDFNFLDF